VRGGEGKRGEKRGREERGGEGRGGKGRAGEGRGPLLSHYILDKGLFITQKNCFSMHVDDSTECDTES